MRLIVREHSAAERRSVESAQFARANNQKPWPSHTKVIEKAPRELLDKELSNAAKEVRVFKFSSGLISLQGDECLEDKLINVGVSSVSLSS